MPIHKNELERIRKNDPGYTFLYLPSQYPALTAEDMKILVNTIRESNNTHLKQLVLNDNQIGDEGAKHLSQLTTITSMSLFENNITDEGAKALAKMPNLEILDLTQNQVTNEGFKELALNSKLIELEISDNLITDDGAKYIFGNTNIKALRIDDNSISGDLLEKINNHIDKNKAKVTTLFFSNVYETVQDIDDEELRELAKSREEAKRKFEELDKKWHDACASKKIIFRS